MKVPIPFLLILLSLLFYGCSIPEPYIHYDGEFNRKAKVYLEGVGNPSAITVCTPNFGKDFRKENRLAQTECNLFGKQPLFSKFTTSTCPLTTLNGLQYKCIVDNK